jgi:homoserine O-acetyltransferase/O-succinyltransferase
MKLLCTTAMALALTASAALAADYPAPKQGEWIAHNFKFHTGEVMADLRLHYATVGEPSGQPVLVLHGTGGSAASMLSPAFAGELFGPGAPLDAAKYYIIIPDAIGAGQSTKPSDGLRAKFPKYNYDDMVEAQHLLLKEGLHVKHLRLVIGNSMGGMQAWMWGEKYPDEMDALVPMASQPTAMASRNWMLRRMLLETIRSDPEYKDGNYTTQPHFLRIANVFFGIATAGGTLAWQKQAPTNAAADKIVDARLAAPPPKDANDFLWQWQSSADYDAAPGLEHINAVVLAINSADDERNPPETGIEEQAMKRVKSGRIYLIPASTETRGHITTGMAKFYKQQLGDLLATAPQRGM